MLRDDETLTFSCTRLEPLRSGLEVKVELSFGCVCEGNVPLVFLVLGRIAESLAERVHEEPLLLDPQFVLVAKSFHRHQWIPSK